MICPVCKGVFSASPWKDHITYNCNENCTSLVYDENNELSAYLLAQKIDDKEDPNAKYKLVGMRDGGRKTTLFKNVTHQNKMIEILKFDYFISFSTQEELDNLIDRILNLKAFS